MRIPVRINVSFFIMAALIGYLSSQSLVGTLIWIPVVFISIMVHEYGHALTSYAFGQSPRIELVAFGGLTIPSGPKLSLLKEFVVVLCGPLFGFGLFIIAQLIINTGFFTGNLISYGLRVTALVNLFWTVVNLVPVMPLDGGQLLRIICEGIFGIRGVRYAVGIGMILSVAFALIALIYSAIIIAVLFFLFAYQNFEMFRGTKNMTKGDSDDNLKNLLKEAETSFVTGNIAHSKQMFEKIRQEAHEGMIYACSTEFLAQVHAIEGNSKGAYDLLVEIEPHLSDDGKCLLNTVSFDVKDYMRVINLSGFCFQTFPSYEIALNAAKSAASQNDITSTIGWLKSSLKYEIDPLEEILKDPHFDSIRNDPALTNFAHKNTQS